MAPNRLVTVFLSLSYVTLTVNILQISSNASNDEGNTEHRTKRYYHDPTRGSDVKFRALGDLVSAVDPSGLTDNLGLLNVNGGSLVDASLCPSILNNVNSGLNQRPLNVTSRRRLGNTGVGNVANGQLFKIMFCLNALNSVTRSKGTIVPANKRLYSNRLRFNNYNRHYD